MCNVHVCLQLVLRCWGPELGWWKVFMQKQTIFAPSVELIRRSSNLICKMLSGLVYASRSSATLGAWFNRIYDNIHGPGLNDSPKSPAKSVGLAQTAKMISQKNERKRIGMISCFCWNKCILWTLNPHLPAYRGN